MLWIEEWKVVIVKVFIWDYISFDELDMLEDENGFICFKGYVVKKFLWEKIILCNVKKVLDDVYIKSLLLRVRVNVLEWRVYYILLKRGLFIDVL